MPPRTPPIGLAEATSTSTPADRLAELASDLTVSIHRAARGNPSLAEAALRMWLREGDFDAWANPQTTLVLMLDSQNMDLVQGATEAARAWMKEPKTKIRTQLAATVRPYLEGSWEGTSDPDRLIKMLFWSGRHLWDMMEEDKTWSLHPLFAATALTVAQQLRPWWGEWRGGGDQQVKLLREWLAKKPVNESSMHNMATRMQEAVRMDDQTSPFRPLYYAVQAMQAYRSAYSMNEAWAGTKKFLADHGTPAQQRAAEEAIAATIKRLSPRHPLRNVFGAR